MAVSFYTVRVVLATLGVDDYGIYNLIGGFITLLVYCRRYEVNVFKMTDITVVPLLLAQAIGRWGNFFNSEAHGVATTYYHLKELQIPEVIIKGMKIGNVYYHPTFLYESVYCFIGFLLLLILGFIIVMAILSVYRQDDKPLPQKLERAMRLAQMNE